jgi:hypothetical protein
MTRVVLVYGIIGGLIIAIPMVGLMVGASPETFMSGGHVYGYLSMIVALTMVFLGIKHYRDKIQGGVIKFGRALLVGLGISAVASVLYAIGWEISLALSGFDFAEVWGKSLLEAARARNATDAEIQKIIADNQSFATMYGNPLYRFPLTFVEMFPVGLLISLISAALLRNSKFLPARTDR